MEPDAERCLVTRCQAGDWKAFDTLFQAHCERAYALAYRITGHAAEAEDVAQETWLRVVKGLRGFRSEARFETWLWRILIHVASDHSRKRAGAAATLPLESAGQAQAERSANEPSEKAALREFGPALQEAIRALPQDCRTAFTLVAFGEKSYAEVAEILQCSRSTVAARIAEAREELSRRLAAYR